MIHFFVKRCDDGKKKTPAAPAVFVQSNRSMEDFLKEGAGKKAQFEKLPDQVRFRRDVSKCLSASMISIRAALLVCRNIPMHNVDPRYRVRFF